MRYEFWDSSALADRLGEEPPSQDDAVSVRFRGSSPRVVRRQPTWGAGPGRPGWLPTPAPLRSGSAPHKTSLGLHGVWDSMGVWDPMPPLDRPLTFGYYANQWLRNSCFVPMRFGVSAAAWASRRQSSRCASRLTLSP